MYQAIITLAYKITVSLPLKFTLGYMSSIHVARDQRPIAVTANSWTRTNTRIAALALMYLIAAVDAQVLAYDY